MSKRQEKHLKVISLFYFRASQSISKIKPATWRQLPSHTILKFMLTCHSHGKRLTTNQEIPGVTPGVVTRFEFLNDLFFGASPR